MAVALPPRSAPKASDHHSNWLFPGMVGTRPATTGDIVAT